MEGHVIVVINNQASERFEVGKEGVTTLQNVVCSEQNLGTPRILECPMEGQVGQTF